MSDTDLLVMSEKLARWLESISDASKVPWNESDEVNQDDDAQVDAEMNADPLANFEECLLRDDQSDDFVYRGGRDERGRPHGGGCVTWSSGGDLIMGDFEHGVREGDGVVVCPREGVARLCGTFRRGVLEGRGKIVSCMQCVQVVVMD